MVAPMRQTHLTELPAPIPAPMPAPPKSVHA